MASLSTIDFTTALARLLSDAPLRNSFRSKPGDVARSLGVRAEDFDAVASLRAEDLEVQAQILLRKRLNGVRRVIPDTGAALGERLWPLFERYALEHRAENAVRDAYQFCLCLARTEPAALSRSELNRLRFVLSQRWLAIFFVRDLVVRGRPRAGLQVFIRTGADRWSEWAVSV